VLEDRRRETRTKALLNFVDRRRFAGEWVAKRSAEAARLAKLYTHEDRLILDLADKPGEQRRTREQLEQLWKTFRTALDAAGETPFAALADARLQVLRASAPQIDARIALGRRWMDRPAPGWTLDSPEGRTVTSESVRRGVTIECFWSSESEFSLHALESLRIVRDRLDPPYAARIVCLNVDADYPRALAACRRLGADFAQVVASGLLTIDPLPELPVVRILDPRGVVRGIWIGWQAEYPGLLEQALELSGYRRR
jgi:hypothetical protein